VRRPGILAATLAIVSLGGCVELGMFTDGSSVSVGRPSRGFLLDGHRLPDHGEGFTTREPWTQRGNRYGTDELLDLITGVGRRLATSNGPRLVVADLSINGGGAARKWHHSHQSGRDVDFVFFMRDAQGQPMEADAMRVFDPQGRARDGSGITVDIPRTWLVVKELVSAHEATVQWVFIYEPIARKLLEHAIAISEPEALIARARLALKQPGDSAPHNDHMHVRVYCSAHDRAFGCVDVGPMELFAEREAERARAGDYASLVAALVGEAAHSGAAEVVANVELPAGAPATEPAAITAPRDLSTLGLMLRRSFDRLYLQHWH
jgi:penicillin-insensitive murein endopeptidase